MERVAGDSGSWRAPSSSVWSCHPTSKKRSNARCSAGSTSIDEGGSRLIDDYALALKLIAPERLDRITKEEFKAYRHLIRFMGNDVPVLVTAIKAKPDWLVTANVEHFDEDVALRHWPNRHATWVPAADRDSLPLIATKYDLWQQF